MITFSLTVKECIEIILVICFMFYLVYKTSVDNKRLKAEEERNKPHYLRTQTTPAEVRRRNRQIKQIRRRVRQKRRDAIAATRDNKSDYIASCWDEVDKL